MKNSTPSVLQFPQLKRIKTLEDFSRFIPEICRMHDEFASKWNNESDQNAFLSELVADFTGKAQYYGSLDENGLMEYLIIIYDQGLDCLFRVFYVHKTKHEMTKTLLSELRTILKSLKYRHCFFTTTRVTKSYDRWVRKLGAKPCEITYNVDLS